MVQTVFAPDELSMNFEQQWKEISPDQLMDTKLKCVFEMPPDSNKKESAEQEEPVEKEFKQSAPAPVFATAYSMSSQSQESDIKAITEVRNITFMMKAEVSMWLDFIINQVKMWGEKEVVTITVNFCDITGDIF